MESGYPVLSLLPCPHPKRYRSGRAGGDSIQVFFIAVIMFPLRTGYYGGSLVLWYLKFMVDTVRIRFAHQHQQPHRGHMGGSRQSWVTIPWPVSPLIWLLTGGCSFSGIGAPVPVINAPAAMTMHASAMMSMQPAIFIQCSVMVNSSRMVPRADAIKAAMSEKNFSVVGRGRMT
jgi:hypothetical protein